MLGSSGLPTKRKRQFDLRGFIEQTLTPLLPTRTVQSTAPMLGIDEGLNNEQYVGAMSRRLLQRGVISMVMPLWSQDRLTAKGERISVTGSSRIPAGPLLPDPGRPIRG